MSGNLPGIYFFKKEIFKYLILGVKLAQNDLKKGK